MGKQTGAHIKFEKDMKKLFGVSSNTAVCKEAGIDRNFYNRVKGNGFQGGVPHPKHVTALCNAIAFKKSARKPITTQKVLSDLIKKGLLPEGSMLEPEKEEQEVLQTVNKTNVIQEDKKAEFDECARIVIQEMQETLDEQDAENVLQRLEKLEYGKNKTSEDFGSWK